MQSYKVLDRMPKNLLAETSQGDLARYMGDTFAIKTDNNEDDYSPNVKKQA